MMKIKGLVFYDKHEAAELLQVHWKTIMNIIDRGHLRKVRIGRKIYIPEQSFLDYLNGEQWDKNEKIN